MDNINLCLIVFLFALLTSCTQSPNSLPEWVENSNYPQAPKDANYDYVKGTVEATRNSVEEGLKEAENKAYQNANSKRGGIPIEDAVGIRHEVLCRHVDTVNYNVYALVKFEKISYVAQGSNSYNGDFPYEHKDRIENCKLDAMKNKPLTPVGGETARHEPVDTSILVTKPFNASSVYFSTYLPSVTGFNYKDQELRRNGITAMLGGEFISKTYLIGGGVFIGGGTLGNDIVEFISGGDVKKIFWILEERLAVLGTFAFNYRFLWSNIENGLIAPGVILIYRKELEDNPFGKTSIYKPYCFDFTPSIDFQYFVNDNFSFYVGYMYRITLNESKWYLHYKYSIMVLDEEIGLKNSKENTIIFGIPGTLRLGVKFHLFN